VVGQAAMAARGTAIVDPGGGSAYKGRQLYLDLPRRCALPEPLNHSSAAARLTPSVADPPATADGDRAAAAPAPPPPGSQRYELLAEIARGGMGVIWRATDTALGEKKRGPSGAER
jgi:hypothetical protein